MYARKTELGGMKVLLCIIEDVRIIEAKKNEYEIVNFNFCLCFMII